MASKVVVRFPVTEPAAGSVYLAGGFCWWSWPEGP